MPTGNYRNFLEETIREQVAANPVDLGDPFDKLYVLAMLLLLRGGKR